MSDLLKSEGGNTEMYFYRGGLLLSDLLKSEGGNTEMYFYRGGGGGGLARSVKE